MAIAEISIIPLGLESPGVSRYVAESVRVLKEEGVNFELNAMGTIVEGEVTQLLDLIKKMHEVPFKMGIKRVITNVKIDDRRDKKATTQSKIQAVLEKI